MRWLTVQVDPKTHRWLGMFNVDPRTSGDVWIDPPAWWKESCGKTLLSTQGGKLSDDKRRPIACSERIIRIGLSHAECRRDS